jgi:hypothetical protein
MVETKEEKQCTPSPVNAYVFQDFTIEVFRETSNCLIAKSQRGGPGSSSLNLHQPKE